MTYALLDYDGFICKAFYAAQAKGDLSQAWEFLDNMEQGVVDRIGEGYLIKCCSGHTFKKDLYPTYKAQRKKSEELGIFREDVLSLDRSIIKLQSLEADDVLIMWQRVLPESIIISDDKDLHYYATKYAGINPSKKIVTDIDYRDKFRQLLAGDNEDNIKGLPKVGMKTADKLLMGDYSLNQVVDIYKAKGFDTDYIIEQLILTMPVGTGVLKDYNSIPSMIYTDAIEQALSGDDEVLTDIIIDHIKSIERLVDGRFKKDC